MQNQKQNLRRTKEKAAKASYLVRLYAVDQCQVPVF